jgi:hypothetical protein
MIYAIGFILIIFGMACIYLFFKACIYVSTRIARYAAARPYRVAIKEYSRLGAQISALSTTLNFYTQQKGKSQ